jgi:tripartite-type tricarboxylate transporter receptor subunit TctC
MRIIAAALTGLLLCLSPAVAQNNFPSRQISIIVGFPPGGSLDLTVRTLAPILQKFLGQPVVVVTRAGAAGGIGAQAAAIAQPDGYTLTAGSNHFALLPAVDKIFGRSPAFSNDDFLPLARLTADPMVVTANGEMPWRTFKDLVDDAKAQTGQLLYGSGGLYGNSHVPIELIQRATGIKLRHLPLAGGGPLLTAIIGKNVTFGLQGPGPLLPHVKAGKLRPLAVMGTERLANFPDVPTLKELGYDLEYYNWTGLFAPAKTPDTVVKVLLDSIERAARDPEYADAMTKAGSAVAYLDQSSFKSWYKKNSADNEIAVTAIGKVQ